MDGRVQSVKISDLCCTSIRGRIRPEGTEYQIHFIQVFNVWIIFQINQVICTHRSQQITKRNFHCSHKQLHISVPSHTHHGNTETDEERTVQQMSYTAASLPAYQPSNQTEGTSTMNETVQWSRAIGLLEPRESLLHQTDADSYMFVSRFSPFP